MIRQMLPFALQVTVLSYILTAFLKKIGRKRNWLDKDPHRVNPQKSSVPSFGGVAVFASFWIGMYMTNREITLSSEQIGLFSASCVILLTGILDDLVELSPIKKSIGILIAANILYFNTNIEFSSNLLPRVSPELFSFISYMATMIWLYFVTNAINLIDGVDGLASSVTLISLINLIITTYFFSVSIKVTLLMMLIMLSAAILGFLPHNWEPATIYLGDTGALFIGFMYAALSVSHLKNASTFSLIIPILLYMVPIFDASYAMIRRILRKQPIGKADSEHFHHRLMQFGLSKRQVVWAMISITILFSFIAMAGYLWPKYRWVFMTLAGVTTVGLICIMRRLAKINQKKGN